MIARACYVRCDRCGNPAEISTEDAREARALARSQGFLRQRSRETGRMEDVCPPCRGLGYDEAAGMVRRGEL